MAERQAGQGQVVLRWARAARVALVVMVVLGSLIATAPAGPALLARQSPDDATGGLIIYDGSPVATASAGQPLTVRLRASAPAALVTYALYGLSRLAFQRLAASYGPVTPPGRALHVWVDQPNTAVFSTRLAGKSALPAGLYLLVASVAQGGSARILLVVTHTALTFKRSPRQAFLWATSLDTAQPVAGMRVEVFAMPPGVYCQPGGVCRDNEGQGGPRRSRPVVAGTTDRDGVFQGALPAWVGDYDELVAVAYGGHGDQSLASTAWTARLQSSPSLGYGYDPVPPGGWRAYLYSDRPIYRPGQTVHVRGVVRVDDDAHYTLPPAGAPLTLTLTDANGQLAATVRRRLDHYGAFNADFALDAQATVGSYTVQATAGRHLNASLPLTVAAYRKPEYAVTVSATGGLVGQDGQPGYAQGAALPLAAQARYYFGAPLAGARISWAVVATDYYFSPPGRDDYIFDDGYGWWWSGPRPLTAADAASLAPGGYGYGNPLVGANNIRLHGQGRANDQGAYFWQAPTALKSGERSQTFTIEATATDASGQEVAQRTTAVIHRALFYVGLRQGHAPGQGFIAQPGKPQPIDLLALGMDGKTVQRGVAVTLSVARRRWIDSWVRDSSGNVQYQEKYEDVPVVTRTVTTGSGGTGAFSFVPRLAGDYRVVATARDALGHVARSALDVWVSSWGGGDADWGARTDDGVRVVPDRATYQPGDTANLLVGAPMAGMLALVTLERGSVLEHHLVRLHGAGDVIAVHLGQRALPNIYVGVTLVGSREATPLWRQGYATLHVGDGGQKLAVTVQADRPTYRPGQRATLTVTARDALGRPARAALSLAVVDQAVLALTGANAGGSLPAFYFDRPLAVSTAGTLVAYADRLPLGQPWWWCRFCPPQLVMGSESAAGAARAAAAPGLAHTGGAPGRAGPPPRAYFPDTALWLPALVTDQHGRAVVSLRLPDSLTTWALASTAADAATRVGDGQGSLMVTKDLLVRPELPRFLRARDHLALRAVLNNTTGRSLRVTVTLQAGGLTLAPGVAGRRTVVVPANGELPLSWPTVVGDHVGVARVTISAIPTDLLIEADAVALPLPIEPASFFETVAGAGATIAEARQTLRLPTDLDWTQGDVRLTLTPSLAAGLGPALTYLRQYPYWCAEQTTSHLFPEMVLRHVLPHLPGVQAADTADLRYALRLLQNLQQPDGGWGWWYETGSSSPFMTAYAVDGLLAARRAGFPVAPGVLSRGVVSLRGWASGQNLGNGELDNPNLVAYLGYVLTQAGSSWDPTDLYAQRAALAPYGQAYLALALARGGGHGAWVASLLASLRRAARPATAGGVWWPQGSYDDRALESPVRSTAVVVDALARLAPADAALPLGVRWLVGQRQDDAWQSTQDTAISLVALGDVLAHTDELRQSYAYAVELGGRTLTSGRVTPATAATGITISVPLRGLLRAGANTLRIRRQPHGGWLYYSYALHYYRRTPFVAARSHGVGIERRYVVLRGGRRLPEDTRHVARAHPGDVLRVELTISTSQQLSYVMIEDPLPSGAEPLDASLLTSSLATQLRNQGTLPTAEQDGVPAWWWTWFPDHTELRDDRAALFVTYLAPGVYHYSYLAQITAAGSYRALPAHIEAMYRPEVNGHSASQQLLVAPH